MKPKDWILPLVITFAIMFSMRHFFSVPESNTVARSGQSFEAPHSDMQLHKPLNLEVDFIDTKIQKKPIITEITTNYARYEFTTDGAVLNRLEFKRNWGGTVGYLDTISPPAALDRERGCFLVALNHATPYQYELLEQEELDDRHTLSYRASFEAGSITKRYTIFKESYRINFDLIIDSPRSDLQPRIFFGSPLVSELAGKDVITGITNDNAHIKTWSKDEKTLMRYWQTPTLFGTQDRYFVHALTNDLHNFTQRGYYKVVDLRMYSILEGPTVSGSQQWTLTFYAGPKESEAMNAVDPRLESTLNYGLFSFISKPLSQVLLYFLNLLYDFVHNYGVAIILLIFLLKLLMLPFTFKSDKGMHKWQEFQKKQEHINRTYKDNPQARAAATAELIKKQGIPGLGGCLPQLLFQLPILWAFSIIFSNAIELFQAPFLWVKDLSSPDPYFLLPLIAGLGIFTHSYYLGDQRNLATSAIVSLFVTVLFSNLSAGLVLYILTSTWLAVGQSYIMKKR